MRWFVRAFCKIAPVLASALLLAGCGGGGTSVKSASTASLPVPPTVTRPGPARPAIRPRVMAAPGLEGIIGARAGDLQRQFGAARLDVIEGDARKLQFSGNACVLDVFLYPESESREPTATYVEARRASDGKDVDRISCVAALRKR